ncbi:MAG: DUF3429 domain-containing protein [Proteobacteria bacterium]|nr:DUF3429 domain-containing protein [Pseudomonadota bacterium]
MPAIPRQIFDERLITGLGYAGLLPMLLCVMFINAPWSLPVLEGYSLAIIAFLAGAWWATALMHRDCTAADVRAVLILSNATVIAAVAAVALMDSGSLLVLAVLFACLLKGENQMAVFRQQPDYYRGMRTGVSAVAIALHLVAFTLVA